MPRDVRIRTFRSTTEGVRPPTAGVDGITAGELATNLADKLLFVGASDGGYLTFRNDAQTVWSVNGKTGDVVSVALTSGPQSFFGLQTFINGLSGAGATFANLVVGGYSFPTAPGIEDEVLTVDAVGNLIFAAGKGGGGGAPAIILRSGDGLTSNISDGDTLTITGGPGIFTVRDTGDSVAVRGITATDSVLGVASFPATDFSVASGVVSLTGNVARRDAAQTFSGLQTFSGGISASGLTAIDPVFRITSVAGNPGNLTIDSGQGGQVFKNRFSSTSFGQYSWLTNIRFSSSSWTKDDGAYSAWRMNQAVATTDTSSVLQWSYATPASTTLNELMTLYGYGDLRIHSGRLVANGATFSGNVSAPNIVNSVNGLTGVVGLPLATTGLSGVASFSSTDFNVSATGHVSLATAPATASGTKTYSVFTARDNNPQSTNFATFDTRNSIGVLDFDGITNESAVFVGIMPEGASYANLQARLRWMTTSAVTGDVLWGVKWEDMNTDLDSDDWSSATELVHTIQGPGSTASGVPYLTSITCTGAFDGITAGDLYRLYVYRGATATSDTISTDVELIAVEVRGV